MLLNLVFIDLLIFFNFQKGAKQNVEFITKKSASIMAVRKMRNYDEDLNLKEFAEAARDIYIKAHELLAQ